MGLYVCMNNHEVTPMIMKKHFLQAFDGFDFTGTTWTVHS